MLETVGQFRLHYSDQAQRALRSLVATPSLLCRVIESQGQDTEIVSIRDQVHAGTGDEGWAIHIDGSYSDPRARSNPIGESKPKLEDAQLILFIKFSFSKMS